MLKLDCEFNGHDLRDDFRMYYRGTYISYMNEKAEMRCMYVTSVDGEDGADCLEKMTFFGTTFGANGEQTEQVIPAESVNYILPSAGYRMVSKTPVYVTFRVNNRTQKKGLHPDNIISTPGLGAGRKFIYSIYKDAPFEGRLSRNVICIDGVLSWRGIVVGTFKDGTFNLDEDYSHLKELIWKLLERSSEVKQFNLVGQ